MSPVVFPIAHHALLSALPFALPVLSLTVAVLVLALRERRRRGSA